MNERGFMGLSKRERQIMDVIYMLGEATAAQIVENLPEKVGDASIRKLIRVVEAKGHLTHRREGHSYVYMPTVSKETASRLAVRHMMQTFFHNSVPQVVSALLDVAGDQLSERDIAEIAALIQHAEEKGR